MKTRNRTNVRKSVDSAEQPLYYIHRDFAGVFLQWEVRTMEEYRYLIIEMISKIENERFLQQIYTIVLKHMRKAGN